LAVYCLGVILYPQSNTENGHEKTSNWASIDCWCSSQDQPVPFPWLSIKNL